MEDYAVDVRAEGGLSDVCKLRDARRMKTYLDALKHLWFDDRLIPF